MSQDFQLQWTYLGYYSHGFVKQGYTHKGQLLGAGTGWSGNSQYLQYKIYYPKGFTAFSFHRYCQNNNSVYSQAVNTASDVYKKTDDSVYNQWYANFETYYCFGFETTVFLYKHLNATISLNDLDIYKPNRSSYCFVIKLQYSF